MSLFWTFLKKSLASLTSCGVVIRSSTVIATALAPATAPLWAIGVAIAIAASLLCMVALGMLDGNIIITVGIVQVMSPTSSEAPPAGLPPLLGVSKGRTLSISGCWDRWFSVCTALAKAWSPAVHLGMPTSFMFS